MTFPALVFSAAILWLLVWAACVQSIRWCISRRHPRFAAAMLVSALAALASIIGFFFLRVEFRHSINGRTALGLDSRWLFIASGLASVAAFIHALRWHLRSGANPGQRPH